MNNEEKILALLEKMDGRLSSLETEVAGIGTGQASLEMEVAGIGTGQASLEMEVAGIRADQRSDRELLELTASQVGNLTNDMDDVKAEIQSVKNSVIRIENDHGKKLDALFDGYKLTYEKLTRIEEEVSKHEEFILRRV